MEWSGRKKGKDMRGKEREHRNGKESKKERKWNGGNGLDEEKKR